MALQLKKARSQVSMKLAGALFAIFALFVQPFVALNIPVALAASDAVGTLSVSVLPRPHGNDSEYVRLSFSGVGTLDLAGWTLRDTLSSSLVRYTFGSKTLGNGESVKLCGDSSHGTGCDYQYSGGNIVWNNSGDTAVLNDGNTDVLNVQWVSNPSQGAEVSNSAAVNYFIPVDSTKPTVNLTAPSTNEYNPSEATVEAQDETSLSLVTGNVYDSSNTFLLKSCSALPGGAQNYTLHCSLASLSDGTYTVRANAKDNAGNVSETITRQFKVDSNSPDISNFTIDNERDVYGDEMKVSAIVTDSNEIQGVTFFLTESQGNDACNGNNSNDTRRIVPEPGVFNDSNDRYEATLNTSALDGKYCVDVQAEDNANNQSDIISRDGQPVVIDNTSPSVELTASPSDLTKEDVTVTRMVSNDENFDYFTYCVKHNDIAITDCTEKTSTPVNDFIMYSTEGRYEITLKAWDKADNSTERTISFEIDKTAPELSNLSATQNTDGSYTLSVQTDDPTSPVEFFLDRVSLGKGETVDNVTWSIVTSILTAGTNHTFAAASTDAAKNTNTPTTGSFAIPAVIITPTNISGGSSITPLSGLLTTNAVTPGASLNGNANVTQSTAGDVLGSEDDDEGDVLGETTLTPSSDGWKILGIAWYWWLLVLAAVGAAGWWFFGRTRSSEEV